MKKVILLIICLLLSAWPVVAAETERDGRNDMKITWIGHACFKIESNGYTLILDPYEDGYVPGLKPLRETADLVLCSHEHGDHNARDLVEITEGKSCPFSITTIDTFHDDVQGAKRGPDTIQIMNLHPHAVRSASRSPDPMEMVSLAAVPLASFKPPLERRLAVRTRAVHKPSIRRLFAFGIPFRVFIPQPGSGSMSGMSLLPDARETGSHLYLPMHPEWPCAECSPLRCSPR